MLITSHFQIYFYTEGFKIYVKFLMLNTKVLSLQLIYKNYKNIYIYIYKVFAKWNLFILATFFHIKGKSFDIYLFRNILIVTCLRSFKPNIFLVTLARKRMIFFSSISKLEFLAFFFSYDHILSFNILLLNINELHFFL